LNTKYEENFRKNATLAGGIQKNNLSCNNKGIDMNNMRKAAQDSNTGAANVQKLQIYSTTGAKPVKVEFISMWMIKVGMR
jgi:hypothetical protein